MAAGKPCSRLILPCGQVSSHKSVLSCTAVILFSKMELINTQYYNMHNNNNNIIIYYNIIKIIIVLL
jgi:hypothetical protein